MILSSLWAEDYQVALAPCPKKKALIIINVSNSQQTACHADSSVGTSHRFAHDGLRMLRLHANVSFYWLRLYPRA